MQGTEHTCMEMMKNIPFIFFYLLKLNLYRLGSTEQTSGLAFLAGAGDSTLDTRHLGPGRLEEHLYPVSGDCFCL